MKRSHISTFIAAASILLLGMSFAGGLHPIGDSLAVFRLPLAIIFAFSLIGVRKGFCIVGGLLITGLSLNSVFNHERLAQVSDHPDFTVYQKNLSFRIRDIGPLTSDILSRAPVDFITLQEVTHRSGGLMDALRSDLPFQHVCPFLGVGGTAVLSKWPPVQGSKRCFERDGMSAMQVETPKGPIWIVSIHLNWPFPYEQAAQVNRLLPNIQGLPGPKIIAGDFNMVPWSSVMHQFETAGNTHLAGETKATFDLPFVRMPIPIDHILAPDTAQGTTERRPKLGSDHYGLVAQIRLDG